MFARWLRKLSHRPYRKPQPAAPVVAARPRFRPGLEVLEDRLAPATLNPGSIAVTGWNALTDTVTLVNLVDIPAATSLVITDRGWSPSNAFTNSGTGDGQVAWTTSASIPAGTVFSLKLAASTTLTNITTGASLTGDIIVSGYAAGVDRMPSDGDGIFIYQGTAANPFFISGFNNSPGTVDAGGWNTAMTFTTAPSAVAVGSNVVTPAVMPVALGIGTTLEIDAGTPSQEAVTVTNSTATNFTATYTKAHIAGFTIATSLRDSFLPGGTGSQNHLINGANALGITLAQHANAQYTGPTTATDLLTWLDRLTDISNWTSDNTGTISSTIPSTVGSSIALTVSNFVVDSSADVDDGDYSSGHLSLREAVFLANAAPDANTITFAPAIAGQTITAVANDATNPFAFGPTAFVITSDITIAGDPSQAGVTISGNNTHRIFGVMAGASLTIQYVTLTGGSATGGSGGGFTGGEATGSGGGGGAGLGGAIFNNGIVTILNTTLSANTAQGGAGGRGFVSGLGGSGGGAVGGKGGQGGFNGGNNSQGGGGGGGVGGAGGNSSDGTGGSGGANENGLGTAAGSGANGTLGGGGGGGNGNFSFTVGNGLALSSAGFGGGGGGGGYGASASAAGFGGGGGGGGALGGDGGAGGFGGGGGGGGKSFTSNPGGGGGGAGFGGGVGATGSGSFGGDGGGGAGLGGAIFNNQGATLTIINSTLTGNTANGGGNNGQGFGGAVFNRNGTVTLTNDTIASNTASTNGGALFNLSDTALQTATVNLFNSILSGSSGGSDLAQRELAGTATVNAASPNVNIIQTSTIISGTFNSSGVSTANPNLGGLTTLNGGPTATMLPGAGPAINAGNNAAVTGLNTDQRGAGRILGGTVDIGAVEVIPANLVVSITNDELDGDFSAADLSLREAIFLANLNADANTITFDPTVFAAPQVISLTIIGDATFGPTGLLATTPITIQGPTAVGSGVTIATSAAMRLFAVSPTGNLTLQNLTLSGGNATGGRGGDGGINGSYPGSGGGGAAGLGGAIFNQGTLSIQGSTFTLNSATGGAGGNVVLPGGLPDPDFQGGGGGGGLAGDGLPGGYRNGGKGGGPSGGAGGGTDNVSGGNASGPGGGGGGGGRQAPGGNGDFGGGGGGNGFNFGGFAVSGFGGFGGGSGGGRGGAPGGAGFGGGNGGGNGDFGGGGGGAGLGGAIFNHGGTVSITNSTFNLNTATGGAGSGGLNPGSAGQGFGGAVFNLNGSLTITNSTLAGNRAGTGAGGPGSGGAIYNLAHGAANGITAANATATLINSIFALSRNLANTMDIGDIVNRQLAQSATINATAPNRSTSLITNTGGTVNGSVPFVTAIQLGLGALASNGGPTQTMAITTASSAFNAGSNGVAPATDQRGLARPQGFQVDIGAFELARLEVTINQAPGQADPTATVPIHFQVIFSGAVTNFVTGDVTLGGTAGATTAIVSGSGTTYDVTVSGMTQAGTVIASIAAGKASDAIGTLNQASTSTDNVVTYQRNVTGLVRLLWPASYSLVPNQPDRQYRGVFTITNNTNQTLKNVTLIWPALPNGLSIVSTTTIASLAPGKSATIAVVFKNTSNYQMGLLKGFSPGPLVLEL